VPMMQVMVLGLIISAFAIFIIVLLSVSLYVSAGRKAEAPARAVTAARRPDEAPPATRTMPPPGDARRFG